MKKLFIAALSISALVACSKDAADTVLTSKEKSVAISIVNSKLETRATLDGAETTEALASTGDACVDAGDLKVFFANSAGVILKEMDLSGTPATNVDHNKEYQYGEKTEATVSQLGQYIFHRVPAEVTQVAVARYEEADLSGKDNWEGEKLESLAALAANEVTNVARELSEIVLYDASTLTTAGTCATITVGNTTTTYTLYKAELTIAPAFARVELINVQCEDLGAVSVANVGASTTGYDELTLKTFAWGPATGNNYLYTWPATQPVLYGSYVPSDSQDADGNMITVTGDARKNIWTANTAISWNIADGVAAPTEDAPMVLTMGGKAYERFVQNDPTLTIKKLYKTKAADGTLSDVLTSFSKGNIYRLNVVFKEKNLDTVDDNLCVKVFVTINSWTVVDVYPEFAN